MAGKKPKSMDVDMITKVPDHVIHHIMSLLPTFDAVRMSLLSKRWRTMWYSPALEFSDVSIGTVQFYNFMEQCLKNLKTDMHQHRETKSGITSFKLEMSMNYRGHSLLVDRWLSFLATQPHLEELDLNVFEYFCEGYYYVLPWVVLNLTSLTSLNLEQVTLEACSLINLPSLKSLSLRNVEIEDEELHKLLIGCHSLEKLYIDKFHSKIFESIELCISSSSLKSLDICGEWEIIVVEATNLESLTFFGFYTSSYDLDSCKKIKNLSFHDRYPHYHDKYMTLIISELPLLESLALYGSSIVEIRNQNLKFLAFEKEYDWDYESRDEATHVITIDAPNLVSFKYRTSYYTLDRFSINSPNLLEADISLDNNKNTFSLDWYVVMIDFLSSFDCSKSISLSICSEEVLMFPEILRRICRSPLSNVKHLKLKKNQGEFQRKSDLRDTLLWLSPSAKTVSIE